jgi:hypothetical protein
MELRHVLASVLQWNVFTNFTNENILNDIAFREKKIPLKFVIGQKSALDPLSLSVVSFSPCIFFHGATAPVGQVLLITETLRLTQIHYTR